MAFDEDDLVTEKPMADLHAPDPELQVFTGEEAATLVHRFRDAMGRDKEQLFFRAARASSKGLRRSMEDRSVIVKKDSLGFCAVYDGHNGSNIAEYAAENLHLLLWRELAEGGGDIPSSLKMVCWGGWGGGRARGRRRRVRKGWRVAEGGGRRERERERERERKREREKKRREK